jgi:hypothetical protein
MKQSFERVILGDQLARALFYEADDANGRTRGGR